ncbi:MAG: DUF1343 domain-containing protein [Prevotellaceae bacterium]|jgi:uncharacterized protein YbbC (DUF1343 family)|nr:DUF1343 domain-containing protein [Prevotellaceae bacterium]MDR0560854.1 DUF1343 domain-containing protein [Prevotellaceae bacterium]
MNEKKMINAQKQSKTDMSGLRFFGLFAIVLLSLTAVNAQKPAADNPDTYIYMLKNKKAGLTANHTSLSGKKHLLDVLLENSIDVVKIYAPEHGFRGNAGAGETVNSSKDKKTGIPIVSLYGANKKPSVEQLAGIDCMVFDMQDVGTRFYTYLSTMHLVMEACAENSIPLIVLDRPNPNGFYIDGPVLQPECKSFVGMHKIPVVHGMTLGELATMINSEKWLDGGKTCNLTVIPCEDYSHKSKYALPTPPSPNLPDMQSVYLYPTLCFFEGSPLSVGRGTDFPFKVVGHPDFKGKTGYGFSFVPKTKDGKIKPLLENQVCYGKDFRNVETDKISEINLDLIIEIYNDYPFKDKFFKPVFSKLAGNTVLQKQIADKKSAGEIRKSWQKDLNDFKTMRKKYLLYPDFY